MYLIITFPFSRFGTHAIVCCPGYSSTAIFFPSDPSHPEYGAGAEEYYYEDNGPSYDNDDYVVPEIPKVNTLTESDTDTTRRRQNEMQPSRAPRV